MSEKDPKQSLDVLKDQLDDAESRAKKAEKLLDKAKEELLVLSTTASQEQLDRVRNQLSEMSDQNTDLRRSLTAMSKQLEELQREASVWRGRFLLSEIDVVSATDRASKAEEKLAEAIKPVPYNEKQIIQERELSWMAFVDPVTGLGNANKLDIELKRVLATSLVQGRVTALFVIDIDKFSHLNGFAGWEQGNKVLKVLGQRLAENVPQGTLVTRRAEDDFGMVVVLDGPGQGQMGESPLVRCRQISDFVLQLLQKPVEVNYQQYPIKVSIGISICPDDADNEGEMLENAYSSLAQAKTKGGGQYCIFNERIFHEKERRANLAAELKSSILDSGLLFLFRSVADAQKGNLVGAMVEPFWQHPNHGRVAQDVFMPLAEEHGLMPELVKQMLAAACEMSRKMKGSITVIVRCPASVMQLSGFAAQVMEAINMARVNPKSIMLEIPGSLLATSAQELGTLLAELGRWGVRLSASYHQETPLELGALGNGVVSQISLGPDLLESVPAQESRRSVVQAFLDVANRMQVQPHAQGVVDSSQAHFLSLHQCQWMSGDFVSPPLELNEFISRRRTTWKFR